MMNLSCQAPVVEQKSLKPNDRISISVPAKPAAFEQFDLVTVALSPPTSITRSG